LIWEITAIAGFLALVLVFLYLLDPRRDTLYFTGFSTFVVLFYLIEIFIMATGSKGTVELFVRGSKESVRTRLDRLFPSEGLAIIWTGARHGGVYPREVLDFHASGPFKERKLASISLAEMSRDRTAVRLVYESNILVTGITRLNAEHSRFVRITSNLKKRLRTTSRAGPEDRRPPVPVEDPVVRYIPDRRMYSIGKNVYCPKCGYEFTAHSVANSPRVKGGRIGCPKCHEQFNYSMEKREKRKPAKTRDPRLASRHPGMVRGPYDRVRMERGPQYPPYPHSPTRRRKDRYDR